MRILMAMAWRNLWRRWQRSVLTAIAMAMGLAMCMFMLSMYEGMFGQMRDIVINRQIGHVQVHHEQWPGRQGMFDTVPHAAAVIDIIEREPNTRAAAHIYGYGLLGGDEKTTGAMLKGIDPVREARLNKLDEQVYSGRYLSPNAKREILLGRGLADELEVGVGGTVVCVTQDAMGGMGQGLYTVVGLINSGDVIMDRGGAWLHLADSQELLALADQVHEIVVVGSNYDEASVIALQERLQTTLPPAVTLLDGATLSIRPWWEVNPMVQQMLGLQGVSQLLMLGVVFGLAALGIINTMLMSVMERTRELGVLKALGMRPSRIILLIELEALFLAAVSSVVGLVIGSGLVAWLVVYGVDLEVKDGEGFAMGNMAFDPVIHGAVSPDIVIQPLIGLFFFAILASLWPAWRASALRPVDAIRED